MNLERAAMKGKLVEAREKRVRLINRIQGDATAIRAALNTALTPAEELNVPVIDEQWDQLKEAWAELVSANQDIRQLERELD